MCLHILSDIMATRLPFRAMSAYDEFPGEIGEYKDVVIGGRFRLISANSLQTKSFSLQSPLSEAAQQTHSLPPVVS